MTGNADFNNEIEPSAINRTPIARLTQVGKFSSYLAQLDLDYYVEKRTAYTG
ncbi:hypothetical protein [Nostoc sp.]|uniref:hypothetical protein n=1 Tax=Nostoc sp. TaxID=1180 RepID=UPI002FF72A40